MTVYLALKCVGEREYDCVGVFSTRELAEECAGPDNVEEHEIDAASHIKFGPTHWFRLELEGNRSSSGTHHRVEPRDATACVRRIEGPWYTGKWNGVTTLGGYPTLRVESPISMEHACGEAIRTRAQWLAMAPGERPMASGSDHILLGKGELTGAAQMDNSRN